MNEVTRILSAIEQGDRRLIREEEAPTHRSLRRSLLRQLGDCLTGQHGKWTGGATAVSAVLNVKGSHCKGCGPHGRDGRGTTCLPSLSRGHSFETIPQIGAMEE